MDDGSKTEKSTQKTHLRYQEQSESDRAPTLDAGDANEAAGDPGGGIEGSKTMDRRAEEPEVKLMIWLRFWPVSGVDCVKSITLKDTTDDSEGVEGVGVGKRK